MHFFLHLTGFCCFAMDSVSLDNIQEEYSRYGLIQMSGNFFLLIQKQPTLSSHEHGQTAMGASPDLQWKPNTSSSHWHRVLECYHIPVRAKQGCHLTPLDITPQFPAGFGSSHPQPSSARLARHDRWKWNFQHSTITWKICCESWLFKQENVN